MATSVPQQTQSGSVDWQTTKQTVRDRTAFLFNNSLMSDIKFVVSDSDGTQVRVPAHKFVLAISSPVFEAMFYGDLAEEGEEVELQDINAETLLEFLRFIYCDEVNLCIDNVLAVLYVAKKYIVPPLAAKCKLFLEDKIDKSNAFQILEESRRFQESKLERRCCKIIDDDTSACLESDGFLTLSHDTLVSLLKRDTLSIQEVHLFEAVQRWAEAKCEEKGLERTGSVIREILGDAVDFIRFPTMSCKDFTLRVVPTKILTSEKALEVYQHIHGGISATSVCTPREGRFRSLTLLRCRRFTDHTFVFKTTSYSKQMESLAFETDKDIHLSGVRLNFGSAHRCAEVRITAETTELSTAVTLFTEENTYYPGSPQFKFGFDAVFKSPVIVKAWRRYVIHVTIGDRYGKNMYTTDRKPSLSANTAGVNFKFEGNGSGTGHLVLELLFYNVNRCECFSTASQ